MIDPKSIPAFVQNDPGYLDLETSFKRGCSHDEWDTVAGWCTCKRCGDGWPDEQANKALPAPGLNPDSLEALIEEACRATTKPHRWPDDYGVDEQVQVRNLVKPIVLATIGGIENLPLWVGERPIRDVTPAPRPGLSFAEKVLGVDGAVAFNAAADKAFRDYIVTGSATQEFTIPPEDSPMALRTTHTSVELAVSPETYAELRTALERAEYHHLIDGETLYLQGIAIVPQPVGHAEDALRFTDADTSYAAERMRSLVCDTHVRLMAQARNDGRDLGLMIEADTQLDGNVGLWSYVMIWTFDAVGAEDMFREYPNRLAFIETLVSDVAPRLYDEYKAYRAAQPT
jgi:hypothetical protein